MLVRVTSLSGLYIIMSAARNENELADRHPPGVDLAGRVDEDEREADPGEDLHERRVERLEAHRLAAGAGSSAGWPRSKRSASKSSIA